MLWCPNCKIEYRQGYTHCSDCNAELVKELATLSERSNGGENSEEWVFLMKLKDDRELDIIEPLLMSYGIPLLKRYKGAGGYLKIVMGLSTFGVDIYVPTSSLEGARDILNLGQDETRFSEED